MLIGTMLPEVVVELVNGWGTLPRREDGMSGHPYPEAGTIAGRLGVPDGVAATLTDETLARIADRLHPVFDASDAADVARLITAFLDETGVRPAVAVESARPLPAWVVPDGSDPVLASAAVTLRGQVCDQGHQRLGVCADHHCADVYLDTSPAGRRRFCSVRCQNRARVAAFRSRRAAARPHSRPPRSDGDAPGRAR